MTVLIVADMEGASGVDDYRQCLLDFHPLFQQGRSNMTEDINAAARGLAKGGADEVHVIDGHGIGDPPNLIPERIQSPARFVGGAMRLIELVRSKEIKSYGSLVLVGQHSMAGTLDGFLSHSNTMETALRINGRFVGEIEELAWLAGYFDVPTVMATGDSAAVREAQTFLPRIEGVVVKTATARDKVECLPPDEARSLIEEAAARASKGPSDPKPFKPPRPVRMETVFAHPEQARLASLMPRSEMKDERTVSYGAEDYTEAFFAYLTAILLGGGYGQNLVMQRVRKALEEVNVLDRVTKIMQDWNEEKVRRNIKEPPPFQSERR